MFPMVAARGHSVRLKTPSDHYPFGSLFVDNKTIKIPNHYGRRNVMFIIVDLVSMRMWVELLESKKNNVDA